MELDALLTSVQELGRIAGIQTPYIDVVLGLTQQLGRSLKLYPVFPDMPDVPADGGQLEHREQVHA